MEQPASVPPETRDWTFVITSGCPQCGFAPQEPASTGDRLRATIPHWQAALRRPDASTRPQPTVWSPVEYACHVRDVCRIFRGRLEQMLTEDGPTFANWDQDAAAVTEDYFHQDPDAVAAQFAQEATATAAAFDRVTPEQYGRPGRRSDSKAFTVSSFAVYLVHDIEHHVYDVAR